MKTSFLSLQKSIPAIFLIVITTSCNFLPEGPFANFEDRFEEMSYDELIITLAPEIDDSGVTFKGEILSSEDWNNVKYGFMWYSLNDNSGQNIPQIEVGQTNEAMTYSIHMANLPTNTTMVVCAYIEGNQYDIIIGNELEFVVPQ